MNDSSSFLSRITSLEEENKRLKNIIHSLFPEKSGRYFICGEGGNKDDLGLPERIMICPAYGSDYMTVYTKRDSSSVSEIDD